MSKCKSGTNTDDCISPNIEFSVLQFSLTDIVEWFNCIVSIIQFPDICKIVHNNPLHKKASRLNIESFRPISILPALTLVYEQVFL